MHSRSVSSVMASLEQRMAQRVWIRIPSMNVLGSDMAGDVKSALNLFQLGIHPKEK